jgi:hypothetical protein
MHHLLIFLTLLGLLAGAFYFTKVGDFRTIPSGLMASPSPSAVATSSPSASPSASPKPSIKPTPKPSISAPPSVAPVPISNTPPSSGLSSQNVQTDAGTFKVSIVTADLGSTKVIVDTASDSDCRDNCPVLPLGTFASRSGAYAGINGPFFCPAEYPSCAGKTNSFDTLLMNKNKVYFNSENNVYSTIPAAIFSPGSARYVSRTLEWGRDTGVDSVIANYPLLTVGGNISAQDNGDPKLVSRGSRCFIGSTGSKVYIGVVFGASTGEAAKVLQAMGIQDSLGLDQGGSTALWFGGSYVAGPGRNLPSGILFVNR